jgi:hypothetical protein
MLVGYNTNISYKDKIYHIQTEDNGTSRPVIVTLLYCSGAILSTKKTSYADIVSDPDLHDKLRTLMKEQHKGMIRDLLSGRCTPDSPGEASARPEAAVEAESAAPDSPERTGILQESEKLQDSGSLDDILINFIMKRAKK